MAADSDLDQPNARAQHSARVAPNPPPPHQAMGLAGVTLRGVSKRYGTTLVVDTVDLEVRQGEFLTLLGPSGCGKTTTLRMIAGFTEPTSGRVLIAGKDVTDLPPQRREIGMVFQDYALFPHLTIAENIAFGLIERRVDAARVAPRVQELLSLIRLPGVAARYPAELSGGQQQRVALARAIAFPPQVLLMDEPLGALDLKMREHMQGELRRIQQELALTTVYVTHDQIEAITMSDRIAVMSAGRIEQLDTPERIYNQPRTRFVAHFVGKVNFIDGHVAQHDEQTSAVDTAVGVLHCPRTALGVGTAVSVAVRPEQLTLCAASAGGEAMNRLAGRLVGETYGGNLRQLAVRVNEQVTLMVEMRPGEGDWHRGDDVYVTWKVGAAVVVTAA